MRKQTVRYTDGLSCSDHLVYYAELNLVIRTDVPTVQCVTSISSFPINAVKWLDEQQILRYFISFSQSWVAYNLLLA